MEGVKGKKGMDGEGIEKEVGEGMEEEKGIVEMWKYGVKDRDVIGGNEVREENLDRVYYLDDGLNARGLMGYGGMLKEIDKEVNLRDGEDGDVVRIEEDEEEVGNERFEVMGGWDVGMKKYVI